MRIHYVLWLVFFFSILLSEVGSVPLPSDGDLEKNIEDTSETTQKPTVVHYNLTTPMPKNRTPEVFDLVIIRQFGNTSDGCDILFNTTTSNQTCCFTSQGNDNWNITQAKSCRKPSDFGSYSSDTYILDLDEIKGECTLTLPKFGLSDVGSYTFEFPANPEGERISVVEAGRRDYNSGKAWWVPVIAAIGVGILVVGGIISILLSMWMRKRRAPTCLVELKTNPLPSTTTLSTTLYESFATTNSLTSKKKNSKSLTKIRFLKACEDGNETEVHTHLKNEIKLDLLDADHNSPLHLAVKNKHNNIIKLLLTKNPPINSHLLSQEDEDGRTAIEIAARTCLPIVKYIIAELGDKSWKTHEMNLVYSAIVNGDDNMLAFLKSQGAEYSGESTFPGSNENFLFRAVKDKKPKAVSVIINHEDLKPDKSAVILALKTAENFLADAKTNDESTILNQIIVSLREEANTLEQSVSVDTSSNPKSKSSSKPKKGKRLKAN